MPLISAGAAEPTAAGGRAAARACSVDAIGNVDTLLQTLNGLSAMFDED
ncbi:hypothetical protein [Planomonospora sp. ID82291]|nr:hypothetical protein [Planomonospora sp. ID82291]MBG0816418.1 hypothetical protein [Planomonospora sp. ID82291]